MNKYIAITVLALIVIAGGLWVTYSRVTTEQAATACTPAAMICADGSVVGRHGPSCEFDACPTEVAPSNSGVRGTVSLSPTCPVERVPPDPACAPKPYEAPIAILRKGEQKPFVVGTSNAEGVFQFSLAPGSYTLLTGELKKIPHCASVEVLVKANEYASTTISCDSGIR